ncbi:MAG: hypothetical protein ACYC8T_05485 [Myxococcaceae bacterium]
MNVRVLLVLTGTLAGCTSVRLVQRDDCWIRQTERWPGRITEEIGPCGRAMTGWTDDRLSRLTQECVAQADFRWRNRAIAAWNRGEPIPPEESEERLVEACLKNASGLAVTENEALRVRLDDLNADRERLRQTNDRLGAALGEAANKPAGTATATADARGNGTSTSDLDTAISEQAQGPGAPPAEPRALPAPRPTTLPATEPRALPAPAPARVPSAEPVRGPSASATEPKALSAPAVKPARKAKAPDCPPEARSQTPCAPPASAEKLKTGAPPAP